MKFKKGNTPWNKGLKNVQEVSDETRKKISEANKGRIKSKEERIKLSIANKGNQNCLGRVLSNETKQKISLAHQGKKLSDIHKQKLSDVKKGKSSHMLNKKHTPETIIKMKKSLKGKIPWNKGLKGVKKTSEKTKEKLRTSMIKHIENTKLNGQRMTPAIGKNETRILNILEENIGYKILRQHRVAGYFLDGYCPILNLAIEVDEKFHEKHKEKDLRRENIITDRLGCQFLRIMDGVY